MFYQHNINAGTKIGIWRIEEAEDFFLEKVPLKKDVSHPYKRLQHLAGRYLLPTLFEDFPLKDIMIADTKKPFLEKEQYHFSISHCGNYAAALVSDRHRVGVDIELVTPRIISIAHKFLHDDEKLFMTDWEFLPKVYLELNTIMWSAKEAVYKWHGTGQLDFKEHMQLNGSITVDVNDEMVLPFIFKKDRPVTMQVQAKVFEPLVLAYVIT